MKPETPFDNIESAHEYVGLLAEAIDEALASIDAEILVAAGEGAQRREEALKLVVYKMARLKDHITQGHRLLNDLRTLRRLLLAERRQRALEAEGEAESTT